MNKSSIPSSPSTGDNIASLRHFPAEPVTPTARGWWGGGGNDNPTTPPPPQQIAVPTSQLMFGVNVVTDISKQLVGLHVIANVNWNGVIEPENLTNYITRWRVWCNQPQPQWVDPLHHDWQQGEGDFSPYQHIAVGGPSNVQPPPQSIIWVSPRKAGTVDFVLEIYHTMANFWREANFYSSGGMPAGVYLYRPAQAPNRSLAVIRAAIPL